MGGDCFTGAAERGGRGLARRQACVEQASFPKTAFLCKCEKASFLAPRASPPAFAAARRRCLAASHACSEASCGARLPRAPPLSLSLLCSCISGSFTHAWGRGCWEPWVPVGAPGLSGTSRCSFAQPGRPVSLWVGMSHLRAGAGMGTGLSLPENDQPLNWTPGCLSALPTAPAGRLGCVHTSPHRRPGRQPSRAGRAPSSACAGGPPRARA